MSLAFNFITTPFLFQSRPLGARQEEFLIVGEVVSCLILALILWRLWRFTVSPFLHPEWPKEFPYWVPCKFSLGKVALLMIVANKLLYSSWLVQDHLICDRPAGPDMIRS
jgi:heme A synthase